MRGGEEEEGKEEGGEGGRERHGEGNSGSVEGRNSDNATCEMSPQLPSPPQKRKPHSPLNITLALTSPSPSS